MATGCPQPCWSPRLSQRTPRVASTPPGSAVRHVPRRGRNSGRHPARSTGGMPAGAGPSPRRNQRNRSGTGHPARLPHPCGCGRTNPPHTPPQGRQTSRPKGRRPRAQRPSRPPHTGISGPREAARSPPLRTQPPRRTPTRRANRRPPRSRHPTPDTRHPTAQRPSHPRERQQAPGERQAPHPHGRTRRTEPPKDRQAPAPKPTPESPTAEPSVLRVRSGGTVPRGPPPRGARSPAG